MASDEEEIDLNKWNQKDMLRHVYKEIVIVGKSMKDLTENVNSLITFREVTEEKFRAQEKNTRNMLVIAGIVVTIINLVIKFIQI